MKTTNHVQQNDEQSNSEEVQGRAAIILGVSVAFGIAILFVFMLKDRLVSVFQ